MRKKLIVVVALTSAAVAVAGMLFVKQSVAAESDPAPNILPAETMKVLDTGERFVLFSLDPTHLKYDPPPGPPPKEMFHYYAVLGKTEIRDPKQRAKLLAALYKGISEPIGPYPSCFNPRHGIRATMAGKTNDLLICFECNQIRTFEKDGKNVFSTTRSPLPTFNEALKKAKLPIAKDK